MMTWQSGVDFCRDNGSKTLPVIANSLTDLQFMRILGQLPRHMDLCPVWLHLHLGTLSASVAWRWMDDSNEGNYLT